MFKFRRRASLQKNRRTRQARFEFLETRKPLDADGWEIQAESHTDESLRQPEIVEFSVSSDIKADHSADGGHSADDISVYQSFRMLLVDGAEQIEVSGDEKASEDVSIFSLRSLAISDSADELVTVTEESADLVRFTMMSDIELTESRDPLADSELIFQTFGGPVDEDSEVIFRNGPSEDDSDLIFHTMNDGGTDCSGEEMQITSVQLPWHNNLNPYDVNGDGYTTALDVLTMVNWINGRGMGTPETLTLDDQAAEAERGDPYPDVDGDGEVSPIDVLSLINRLNDPSAASEEAMDAMSAVLSEDMFDCAEEANDSRLALPDDWVDSDAAGSDATRLAPDWIDGDPAGDFADSSSDGRERHAVDLLEEVDAVFAELANESDLAFSDAVRLEV